MATLPGALPTARAQVNPFQHGVASGDPYPNSVLLWTRITSHEGDLPGREQGVATPVRWEVSREESFATIAASGTATAVPAADMTVKVEAGGLAPYTTYFYRFTITDGPLAGSVSPVGRTRTAPSRDQDLADLRFVLTSCSNWEAGHFHAYGDMARRGDIDCVLHVGDYIYEYPIGEYTGKTGTVRPHSPAHEIVTLQDYRERYGQYRTDPNLQAAHAAHPWIVTWDDHEIANDAWAAGAENHTQGAATSDPSSVAPGSSTHGGDEGDFFTRRAAAVQAYLEWLPIRAVPFSQGGHIYRNLSFGKLVDLNILDLRTYRNEPPGFTNMKLTDDPNRTMLGSEQFGWLANQLQNSQAVWNLIGNSVMVTPVLIPPLDRNLTYAITQLLGLPEEGMPYNFDQWDGYMAERRRMLNFLNEQGIRNTIWLTGDIHTSWAADVPLDAGTYPASGAIAAEFVTPSVTSSNIDDILKLPEANGLSKTGEAALTFANRHIRWVDLDRHGYAVVQVTPDFVHTDWIFMHPEQKLRPEPAGFFVGRSARKYREGGVVMHNAAMPPR